MMIWEEQTRADGLIAALLDEETKENVNEYVEYLLSTVVDGDEFAFAVASRAAEVIRILSRMTGLDPLDAFLRVAVHVD